jgi:phosphocarrier protein
MANDSQADAAAQETRELVVRNKMGIHARPAAMIVRIANRFRSELYVENDGDEVNGKSIMGLMMLAAGSGTRLTFRAEGEDAAAMLDEMEALFKRQFEED